MLRLNFTQFGGKAAKVLKNTVTNAAMYESFDVHRVYFCQRPPTLVHVSKLHTSFTNGVARFVVTDTHTHRHKLTTVIFAAHARRGLSDCYGVICLPGIGLAVFDRSM